MILLLVAFAWLAGGVFAALEVGGLAPVPALGGAGIAAGLFMSGRRPQALLVGAMLAAALLSIARFESTRPPDQPGGIAEHNDDGPVRMLGLVATEPEERVSSQRFVVDVDFVAVGDGWQETEGRVLVTAPHFPRFEYGDALDLTARLQEPPVFETFDYRDYLARQGIGSTALFPLVEIIGRDQASMIRRALIDLRSPFGEALERSLPEPESALARGILLGQRASIPPEVNEEFNAAGVSHLIAISGYNVMLVAGFVLGSLVWVLGRRQATLVAMAAVVLYAVFVGGEPPVLRATLMAIVMLGATFAGRPASALTGVGLAGAVLTVVDPQVILDVSFQLSFAATVGIVVLATPLRERLALVLARLMPAGASSFLSEQFALTTAATLAVLPVIAGAFGRVSLVALPANLLATPVFAYALLGSAVTAAAGVIDTGAGRAVGELAFLPLTYLVLLADVASRLPLASLAVGGLGLPEALLIYGFLGEVTYVLLRRRPDSVELVPLRVRLVPLLTLAALGLAGMIWWNAIQTDDDRLRFTVLDVGQGDALLIETPSNGRILVDGGPSSAAIAQALGAELPAAERRIDLLVLTHPHDDHVAGLVEVLQRYDVGAVIEGPLEGETAAYQAFRDEVRRQRLPVYAAEAGAWLDLGDGVGLDVLAPLPVAVEGGDVTNNSSLVLRLAYGDVSFLLTSDIEAEAEGVLLESGFDLASTVLKVAHHGSSGSTTDAFLDAVSPSLAVVSSGESNTFGHPDPGLRLRLAGLPLLRTDRNGSVQFQTDGERLWVDFERGTYDLVRLEGVIQGKP